MNNMTAKLRTRRAEARTRKALNRAIDNASSGSVRNELTELARERGYTLTPARPDRVVI